jgi:hypothetical protein
MTPNQISANFNVMPSPERGIVAHFKVSIANDEICNAIEDQISNQSIEMIACNSVYKNTVTYPRLSDDGLSSLKYIQIRAPTYLPSDPSHPRDRR